MPTKPSQPTWRQRIREWRKSLGPVQMVLLVLGICYLIVVVEVLFYVSMGWVRL